MKAAIYTRVSTHWQADKDSLLVQERELVAYCTMVLGVKDYQVYVDAGYSGKNTERPSYQEMMKDIRSGAYTHLLVWKIDRISRNLLDFADMYAELKELGVAFVSKNEQFDTSSAIGEAMLKIILVFAELERNMTSERVTATMISRASNGQWNGGKIPYGYNYDKATRQFSINEEEAKVYYYIVERYETLQSLVSVARLLNASGIKNRYGRDWNVVTLNKMLKNIFYTGCYRYNTRTQGKLNSEDDFITIENHHPQLIDKEHLESIQRILIKNRRQKKESYARKYTHIFAGLIKCGHCGANMIATLDKRRENGYRPSMYCCSTRRRSHTCTNPYVNDITVGTFVFTFISNIMSASGNETLDAYYSKLSSGLGCTIDDGGLLYQASSASGDPLYYQHSFSSSYDSSSLDKKIESLQRSIKKLNSLYLHEESVISENEYINERKELEREISDLKKTKESSETPRTFAEKSSYLLMSDQLLNNKISFKEFARLSDTSVAKTFVNSIITKIIIKDKRIVSITLKNGIVCKFNY